MNMTIKEFAQSQNKSVQAVYRQMRAKGIQADLSGHIQRERRGGKNVTVLDDTAQALLIEASHCSPTIIEQTYDKERIEELEHQVKLLTTKILSVQDQLLESRSLIDQLRQEKIAYLEHKEEKHRRRWFGLFG